MRTSLMLVATVAVGVLGAFSARADDVTGDVPHVTVSFGDLDPSRPNGANILLGRIRTAAGEVCGGKPDNRDLAGRTRFDACTKQAMDGAIARLGNPTVAAAYGEAIPQVAQKP